MNETERKVYLEQFNRRTHVLGRAVCVITAGAACRCPVSHWHVSRRVPTQGAVGKGFLSVGVVWAVASVAEFLIYTPMLGRWRRLPCLYHRQPHQHEDPVRGQCARHCRHKTGTAENEIISDALDRDKLSL